MANLGGTGVEALKRSAADCMVTTLLTTNQATKYMWQSPSSEDSNSLASQETALILWKMIIITAFTRATHVSVS